MALIIVNDNVKVFVCSLFFIPFLFWNIRVYSGFKIKYNKNIIKYE